MHDTFHHRRSIRLEGYDYTQTGAYFVTLITASRVERFGEIVSGEMQLNPVGQMVLREWQRLPVRFPGWMIDAFVIMPNHIHGILINGQPDPARAKGTHELGSQEMPHMEAGSLGAVVRTFKSSTTLRYHSMRGTDPGPLWHRNYYEHILRGPDDLNHICAYILANPAQWEMDHENPDRGPS